MGKIFLVRHAQAEWSTHYSDPVLSEFGRKQAKQLSEFFLALPVSMIITSPLKRAIETAQIIAQTLNCPLIIAKSIKERGSAESDEQLSNRVTTWLDQCSLPNTGTILLSHGGFLNALFEKLEIVLSENTPKDRFGSLIGIAEILSLESLTHGSQADRIFQAGDCDEI